MTPRGSDKSARPTMGDRATGTIRRVTRLHVHRFGPPGPVRLLALHGLTGHGKRWETSGQPAPARNRRCRTRSDRARQVVVGGTVDDRCQRGRAGGAARAAGRATRSWWWRIRSACAVAMHLAAAHPDRVAGLVLLDPAIGLDGAWMREIADAMLASPDYSDAAEARAAKTNGSWADVDPAVVDAELDEHLVELPGGRCTWRLSLPAMMAYWSELAREIVLPPKGIGTTLVRAAWTSPSYVTDRLIDCTARAVGRRFSVSDVRLRSHGGRDQTGRGRRTDPRTDGADRGTGDRRSGRAGARAGRLDTRRPGVDVRRHRRCRKAFQPAHRRLDHAHRLLRPALASGDHRVGTAGQASDHPAVGTASGRRGSRQSTARSRSTSVRYAFPD